jgi:serine/threonine protein phosphatase PrpC
MRIDVGAGIELRPRDTVVVASDGLTDNVHLDEIVERVRKGPLSECAAAVVELAEQRMSGADSALPSKPDDLSLILFRKPGTARIIDE